jgi:hypothetical protein
MIEAHKAGVTLSGMIHCFLAVTSQTAPHANLRIIQS